MVCAFSKRHGVVVDRPAARRLAGLRLAFLSQRALGRARLRRRAALQ
jgi:hypothetical protein